METAKNAVKSTTSEGSQFKSGTSPLEAESAGSVYTTEGLLTR